MFEATITGPPLSTIGLGGASLVKPDGTEEPLIGLIVRDWDSTHSVAWNIRRALEDQYPGCKLVIPL